MSNLPAGGHELGQAQFQAFQPPPLLRSQDLHQSSHSPESANLQTSHGYLYARNRSPPIFYQQCGGTLSSFPVTTQHETAQSYGRTNPCSSGPPPLISNFPSQNVNPFYLKKLTGNIRICQGCRGSLRSADGMVPNPPFDFVIARLEKRQFRDASGTLKVPAKPSAAHYHFRLACICAIEANFLPSSLVIPCDVSELLCPIHRQHLQLEFGFQV